MKYQLLDVDNNRVLASGYVERIGAPDSFNNHQVVDVEHHIDRPLRDHDEAFQLVLDSFQQFGPPLSAKNIVAVGHRVVHGGNEFSQPVVIDDVVEAKIARLSSLAPLHNPANLKGIKSARRLFGQVPHVAVFDTAYHQTLGPESYNYAIDRDLAAKHGIRRYGFHGTSHAYVSRQAAEFLQIPLATIDIIVLHLGNGGSATAIRDGKSIETSMGMTPLEGMVMGTRSGDIDPGVIFHLYREVGLSIDEIDELLNQKSGLAGISGGLSDMRDLHEAAERGDEAAQLALETYYRRVKKYIGAYWALLGHLDVIVFTAGIGEKDDKARTGIINGLEQMGIKLDPKLNAGPKKQPTLVSADDSTIKVLVVPTNEEREIATQAIGVVDSLK
jgi:acetate kinase